jgi:hypothetical protein
MLGVVWLSVSPYKKYSCLVDELYMFVKLLICIIVVPFMNIAIGGLVMFSEPRYIKCHMFFI